ncbi:MAG: PAS domain S-box protein [Actinobacteria bacterium]|nr:MAG: PAS domain S-box protein [Actinomycetota bacterium]
MSPDAAGPEEDETLASSEERFRLLIENSLDLITVLKKDLTISYVGPSVKLLLGYEPEEMIGKNLLEMIHSDDIAVARAALDLAFRRPGVSKYAEVRIRHKDGSWRIHEASSTNLLDDPKIQGLVINSRDVTERKSVENRLAQESNELEAIFQALPDLLFRFAPDGVIIDYKAGKPTDLYLPPEVFLGRRVQDVLPESVGIQAGMAIQEVNEKGSTTSFEYSLTFPEGEQFYEARMFPALENEVIAVIRNITERKRSERFFEVQRDLALALSGTSDLGEMSEASLQAIFEVTGMDSGAIYLVDGRTGSLDIVYHRGLTEDFVAKTAHYDSGSPNVRVVMAGEPIFLKYEELENYGIHPLLKEGLKALAVIPLKSEGKVVGCINVASHSFTELQQPLRDAIEVLASAIGQSIERARLVSALRDSERRYRLLHDYAGEAILTYDREMKTINVNRRACEILGYGADELLGSTIFELGLIHPNDVERARRAAGRLLSGLEVGRGEIRFLKKDGSVMTGDVTAAVLLDREGEPIAVTNIVSDITASRAAEQALRESEEHYRITFESTGTAMVLIGLDGTIVDANQEVEKLLGYNREDVVGKMKYMEFVHPDDLRSVTAYSRHLLSGELTGPVQYEARTIRRDGRVLDTLIHVSVLPGIDKSVASLLDITEKKRYERELEVRAEQLRDFLDVTAHELRHPVTLLEGYAETLGRYGMEMGREEMLKSLAAIGRATSQVTNVVEDLLDISRIERGLMSTAGRSQELRPLVYQAIEEMMVRGSDNRIEVDFAPDLDKAWIDPDRFLRLMIILLDNAVKYSPPASLIEVKGEVTGEEALVSVMDRGVGIPTEDRENVFERFKQVGGPLHHSNPGLGLGLYIARRIVEAHGGRIWNEPRAGGGSSFRFTLPLRENRGQGQATKRLRII